MEMPPRLSLGLSPGRLAGRGREGGAGCHFHTYPFGFAKSIILPRRTVETSDSVCIDSPIPDERKGGGMEMSSPLSLGLSPGRLEGRGREKKKEEEKMHNNRIMMVVVMTTTMSMLLLLMMMRRRRSIIIAQPHGDRSLLLKTVPFLDFHV